MDMLASLFAANYAFYSNYPRPGPTLYRSMFQHPAAHLSGQRLPLASHPGYDGLVSLTNHQNDEETGQNDDCSSQTQNISQNNVKFSIENILKSPPTPEHPSKTLETKDSEDGKEKDRVSISEEEATDNSLEFSWLQCTRYKPPKLQRTRKDTAKKRKLGRNPRVPFTQHQVTSLEHKFRQTHYLSSIDVVELSAALNLTETRVKIWFQNRRARERRDRESFRRVETLNTSRVAENGPGPSSASWPIAHVAGRAAMAHYRNMMHIDVTPLVATGNTTSDSKV